MNLEPVDGEKGVSDFKGRQHLAGYGSKTYVAIVLFVVKLASRSGTGTDNGGAGGTAVVALFVVWMRLLAVVLFKDVACRASIKPNNPAKVHFASDFTVVCVWVPDCCLEGVIRTPLLRRHDVCSWQYSTVSRLVVDRVEVGWVSGVRGCVKGKFCVSCASVGGCLMLRYKTGRRRILKTRNKGGERKRKTLVCTGFNPILFI